MPSEEHKLVPLQTQGLYKDLKHDVLADTVEDAEDLFVIAKDKLLDVNHWKHTGGPAGMEFQLMDEQGTILERPAHGLDLIGISLPGDRTTETPYLLNIDEIAYDDYPDEDYETFAMRLGPAGDPLIHNPDIATGTIVIERRGRHLTAHYFGRNESAITSSPVPDAQWLGLITGLLQADISD